MLRSWREREFARHLSPAAVRSGLKLWGFLVRRPRLYGLATGIAARMLSLAGKSRFRWLPLASGWTRHRRACGHDLPGDVETAQAGLSDKDVCARHHLRLDPPLARCQR